MKSKFNKLIAKLLTFAMLITMLSGFTPTAFADETEEANNITLSVSSPLGKSAELTVAADATFAQLKEKIEEVFEIDFENEGYGIYCSAAGIYYDHNQPDDTATLDTIGIKDGYAVYAEKTMWTVTEENSIKLFGLTITGGTGCCEPYGDYSSADFSWNYYYKQIDIRTDTPITITGTGEEFANILIRGGSWHYVTLKDVSLTENGSCITLNPSNWLDLTLEGTNTLVTNQYTQYGVVYKNPAISLNNSSTYLWINKASTGSLTATTNCDGMPGIGTRLETDQVYGFVMKGGKVTANGGANAPGVRCNYLSVSGGTLNANGGTNSETGILIQDTDKMTSWSYEGLMSIAGSAEVVTNGAVTATIFRNNSVFKTDSYEHLSETAEYDHTNSTGKVYVGDDEYVWGGTRWVCVSQAVEEWNIGEENESDVVARLYKNEENSGLYDLVVSGTGNMKAFDDDSTAPWLESYCDLISSVGICSGVTNVGSNFMCDGTAAADELKTIVISDSVSEIGDNAFGDCYYVQTLDLGEGVKNIGINAFSALAYDSDVITLELPDSLETVASGAFNMANISALHIPANLTSIGKDAFGENEYLATITADEGNTAYKAVENVLYDYDGTELILYASSKADTEFTVLSGVETITEKAFYKADTLEKLILPASVTSVENNAFYYSEIDTVVFENKDTSIATDAFFNDFGTDYIQTIAGHTNSTAKTFADSYTLNSVVFESICDDGTVFDGACDSCGTEVEMKRVNIVLTSTDVTVNNFGSTAMLIVASYSENKLVDMEIINLTEESGRSFNFASDIPDFVCDSTNADTINAFLWSDILNLMPLCDDVSVTTAISQ